MLPSFTEFCRIGEGLIALNGFGRVIDWFSRFDWFPSFGCYRVLPSFFLLPRLPSLARSGRLLIRPVTEFYWVLHKLVLPSFTELTATWNEKKNALQSIPLFPSAMEPPMMTVRKRVHTHTHTHTHTHQVCVPKKCLHHRFFPPSIY